MKYLIGVIAAAVMCTSAMADDGKDAKCNDAAKLALATYQAMQQGATEDQILDWLRERKIYSGYLAWGAQEGMKAPADTPEWMVQGDVLVMCKKRGDI